MAQSDEMMFVVPGDDPPQIQGSPHLEKLNPHGRIVVHTDRPASTEEKIARVKDTQVVLNTRGAINWTGDDLKSLPNLKMITTCSIGTDMIDLDAASELGIIVSIRPGRTAPIRPPVAVLRSGGSDPSHGRYDA